MSYYLYQLAYSRSAIKAMVASPSDREAAARKLIEALGGKLHHLFFAFGKWDVACLIEGPDDKFMMAGAAAVGASGTVSKSATTKLMKAGDAVAAHGHGGKSDRCLTAQNRATQYPGAGIGILWFMGSGPN